MSYLLPSLTTKSEVDNVIKSTEDLVLVLRFGRDSDSTCMRLDDIVSIFRITLVDSKEIYGAQETT